MRTLRRKLKRRNSNAKNASECSVSAKDTEDFENSLDSESVKPIKPVKPTKKLKPIVKKRRKIKYKKQRCAFVTFEDGEPIQCRRNAVGKGTLCKKHGGDPIIKENMLDKYQEKAVDSLISKFQPAVHPIQYIEMARFGASEVEIAAMFEVSLDTMKSWAEKYESFNTAYEVGQAMHEAWWLQQGKDNLNDRSFNTSLFKYLTMNKLGYSDKIEQKNLNMNVHGVLAVPDKVSPDEWEADEEIIDVNS